MQPTHVSVIVPLAVEDCYTYRLPQELANKVFVGSRVIIQFGARRYYTGIVIKIYFQNPQPNIKLKEVCDVIETSPVVLPLQLQLWQWISNYYMCTLGDVMKAALPSGLKLESETLLVKNADFDITSTELSKNETEIVENLHNEKGCSILKIEKELHKKNIIRYVNHLIDIGAIRVQESFTNSFKPRTETHVKLNEHLFSEERLNKIFSTLSKANAQKALLTRYLDLSDVPAALSSHNFSLLQEVSIQQLCESPSSLSILSALRKRNILYTYPFTISRLGNDAFFKEVKEGNISSSQPLSTSQQRAHDEIVNQFQKHQVCLLHGVTSSGKTQVYIRLIEEAIAQGKQVLYLLPEIALTTQITSRLERVFGNRMGVYHSKYPDSERIELWQHQLGTNAYPLILGVRSSIFLPFQNLGLIIVDEEHEQSYKQQEPSPRYQARDTAIILARFCKAKVLLGTATPSLETYHNVKINKYGLVKMMERFGGVEMPKILVEDTKELHRKKMMPTPFSPQLIKAIQKTLTEGKQTILFQNRRGWSPIIECRTCGWVPRCTKCDVSLTYHQVQGSLVCHYCGTTYDIPHQCPACGGTELRDMGYGTEKIESETKRLFPQARTARLDIDTTQSRVAYEKIINDFAHNKTDILIGTQMVTKGLDFENVTTVGILSADQMLNQPDFRATEKSYQMMQQVAGRAGRRQGRGLVVLQTSQADLPIIQQIVNGDYESMYEEQMQERQTFNFPPICRLINILLKHRDEAVVKHAAEDLATLLYPHFGANLLGPDRPLISRIRSLYIRQFMVKISPTLTTAGVRRTLFAARDVILNRNAYKSVHIYFDVDP